MAEPKIKLTAETAEATRAIKSFGQEVTGLSGKLGSLTGIAGTLGGALSISAFGSFIKNSIDAQDEIGGLSKKTGILAEDLFGLKFAADQNGASLDLVSKATKELAVNLANSPDKFAKMGITATDAAGALVQVADIVSRMPEGFQRTTFLADVMGKKLGPEMAEFLGQGGESLRNYIERGKDIYQVTGDNVAMAKEYKDQVAELEARSSAFGMSLASILLPNMVETTKAMNELAQEGHPVLALWRGLMGMGKVPWDLLAPPEDLKKSLSSANRLKELEGELAGIEAYLKRTSGGGDGLIGKWLHGSPEEQRKRAEILRNQIDVLKKHGAELDKPSAATTKPSGGGGGVVTDAQAAEIARQQEKYDKLYEMAILYDAKDQDRVRLKMAFDLEAMEKEKQAARDKGAWNDDLEKSYQQARTDREAMAQSELQKMRDKELEDKQKKDALEIQFMRASFQFKKSMRIADLGNALGLLAQATEGMASHSRRAFEINKAASIASIIVKAPKIITDAFDSGQNEWGSYWGGVAYAAAAAIAIGAQLSAAQSATFGGGGGVAPAYGGTAGMPASSAADQAGGSSSAPPAQGVAAAPQARSTIHLHGSFFDAQTVRDLAQLIAEAKADGVNFDVVTD